MFVIILSFLTRDLVHFHHTCTHSIWLGMYVCCPNITCLHLPQVYQLYCWSFPLCAFSGRSPAASGSKKHKSEEEPDDLTKEMEEPPSEPNIQEVTVPKPGMFNLYYTVLTLEVTCQFFGQLESFHKCSCQFFARQIVIHRSLE